MIPFDLDGFTTDSSAMTYVGGPLPKLDTYGTRFRVVEALSLEPAQSRDFIHGVAKEL